MKESDNCKPLLCIQGNAMDGSFPECQGCIYEEVCQGLESKVIEMIFRLGLHEKLDDPLNVANIIEYYEQNGIDCETLKKRFKEIAKIFSVNTQITEDKKIVSAYIEVIHKLETAKK